MKKIKIIFSSLEIKVTLIFAFTIILLFFLFIFFHQNQSNKINQNLILYYKNLANYMKTNRLEFYEVKYFLEQNGFKSVHHLDVFSILENKNNKIYNKKDFELIQTPSNKIYLHFLAPRFRILFEDQKNKLEKNQLYFFTFLLILILILFIYYLIIKNIKDHKITLKSRQLFLRTIMHELKTPIAKGRIVSELINDELQKKRMINIFEVMNFLINDFAKTEQIMSKNYQLNLIKYDLKLILNNSINMLMIDEKEKFSSIIIELEKIDLKLAVDIDLFLMAFKNLIDNALKYSIDQKVKISFKENEILFISIGKKLEKPLKNYLKPFSNIPKSKNHGMGLGLYIVNSILELHNFKLKYEFKVTQNIFKIII